VKNLGCVSNNRFFSPQFFFKLLFSFSFFYIQMREELITSAISFLSDPKVQSAPLAKKVSFLESKGMNSEEIEEAMARANGKSSGAIATAPQQGSMMVQPGMAMQQAPPLPPRPAYDWRDIFIAAVLAGGVGYGVWTLAKVNNIFGIQGIGF
jgi:peroxin-14